MARLVHTGGLRALYKGLLPFTLRDLPGWAAYFYTNEVMKYYLGVSDEDGDWDAVSLAKRMFIGGCSGMTSWGIGYPFDVLKTEMQTNTDPKLTLRKAIAQGHQMEGTRYFFKGFVPTMQRAFLVSLVVLPIFEYMIQNWMPTNED